MMHRSKKLPGSGDQEYCNEKRSVNESMAQHISPNSSRAPGDADECQPSPWFCPSVSHPEAI